MADLSYAQAHAAASTAIATLGYLAHDEFERHVIVSQILEVVINGERFIHNRQKAASRKQVDAEISDIIKAAERMSQLINSLHGTTFCKLSDAGIDPNRIDAWCSAISSTCKHLVSTEDVPEKLQKSKSRYVEQQIGVILARMFVRETGRPASRTAENYSDEVSGDFLNLVQSVFVALNIKSSASGVVDYVRRLPELKPVRQPER